jgi:addiction module HigA family antidote
VSFLRQGLRCLRKDKSVEAARQLRVSTTRLNEIIRGKRGITADTAWRLGDWLGTGPDVWMNLQSKWDLWQARKVRKTA